MKRYISANSDEPSIIEMDGKWYQEINGKVIEIANPNLDPIPPKQEAPNKFSVGDKLENLSGKFQITSIEGNNLTIKYIDGAYAERSFKRTTEELKVEINRFLKTQKSSDPKLFINLKGSQSEAFTIGYLAAHGTIVARITPDHYDEFKKTYGALTGDSADTHLKNKKYLMLRQDDFPMDYFRIYFSAPPEIVSKLSLHEENVVPISYGDGAYQFNSRRFIFSLFRFGFLIGKNGERINAIASKIQKENRTAFYQGVLAK